MRSYGACNGFKKMNMRTISKEIITKSKNNQAYAFFFLIVRIIQRNYFFYFLKAGIR